MIRYYINNLESSKDFTADSVQFVRVGHYEENIEVVKTKYEDRQTFNAYVANSKTSLPSTLFHTTLPSAPAMSVNDMMILLSLAQSRNIFFSKAEDTERDIEWAMPLSGNRLAPGFAPIINKHEIEDFLETSLRQLRKPRWIRDTGFSPAVFWWLESVYANRPLETKYVSSYIALEVLANSYCARRNISRVLPQKAFGLIRDKIIGSIDEIEASILSSDMKEFIAKRVQEELNRLVIREKIIYLRDAYNWHFMTDERVRDWVEIRNKYMHEGSTAKITKLTRSQIATRWFQLVLAVQIALIDLLGFPSYFLKKRSVDEINKEPRSIIYRHYGPISSTT